MSTPATTAAPTTSRIMVNLKNVRLSYPNLFQPKASQDGEGEPKYSAAFILDATTHAAAIKELKDLIEKLCKEKWGKKLPADKVCLRDGADKDEVGYGEGTFYISSSNKKKPRVVDRDKTDIREGDARIFGGIYVNAAVNIWVMENKFGKRINASLEAVQYVKPGEAFGAPPIDIDATFGVVEAEPGEEDDML